MTFIGRQYEPIYIFSLEKIPDQRRTRLTLMDVNMDMLATYIDPQDILTPSLGPLDSYTSGWAVSTYLVMKLR